MPAGAGSTLVAAVAIRTGTGTVPAVSDDLGGTWHETGATGGDGSSSHSVRVFIRANAGGVGTVSASVPGAPPAQVRVVELTGGPAGLPDYTPAGVSSPTAAAHGPLTVAAPAGAFVLGVAAAPVTNRVFQLDGTDWTQQDTVTAANQLYATAARRIVPTAQATGPSWTLTSTTGNTSASLATLALHPDTGTAPDPDPPARVRQLLDPSGTWRPATTTLL